MRRTKRESIMWALVENENFIGDDEGVMVFETRTEARRFREIWAKFYRQHEMRRKAPYVVKVRIRVDVIKRDGKPEEPLDEQGH